MGEAVCMSKPWSAPSPCVFRPEAELLLCCARTDLSPALNARIMRRIRAGVDWVALLDLAKYHGVAPLLFRALAQVCPDDLPKEFLEPLRRYVQAATILSRALVQELVVLTDAFVARHVPVIPFKGATLAAAAYRDLSLRDFDDLDFIVPQSSLDEAQSVLWSQGYRPRDREPASADSHDAHEPYHVFVKKGSLTRVDLQWVMVHQHFSFLLDRAECWQRMTTVSIHGRAVSALAPEDLLIVLCVHGSKHAWEQLKWVCDVAELLRAHPSIDWEHVFSRATAWRCRRMVAMGLELARRLVDAPVPPAVQRQLQKEADISLLALRMPYSLLVSQEDGISEKDAIALYFALKDSWWERWRFGLGLCAAQNALTTKAPSWFRWHRRLQRLSRMVQPLHAVASKCIPSPAIRRAIGRWLQQAA